MTDALEEQLRSAAATPSHELDVHALIARTRLRRRRLVGGVAAAVVVVLATVGIATIATGGSSGDDARIAIGPHDGASTPDGWTRVSLERGTSIAVPEGWGQVSFASQYLSILGVVGTGEPGVDGFISACETPDSTPSVSGTWVSLYDLPGGVPDTGVRLPDGETADEANFRDRPTSFSPAVSYESGSCGSTTQPATPGSFPPGPGAYATWVEYLFRDHGRLFVARVVSIDPAQATTDLGDRVLDTFRVDADAPTIVTTTTVPTVTTAPATTTPPPADASPDELAIRDVYMHLIGQVPRDALDAYVEDFASIADSWRAGMAQNSEDTMQRYTMRIDSVTMTDDTHADVRYSLLYDARPAYPDQAGGAVKIDGRWYITRETVCSLLTHGGITCPARTTPVP
jgi:hypothetical protein